MRKCFNPGWLYSNNRRRHQRRINQAMRIINKGIEKDELWRGRFVVRTGATNFIRDKESGGYLEVELLFIDKRTGFIWKTWESVNSVCSFGGWHMWHMMNRFITEINDVWTKEGRDFLYSDKTDYTKI